MFRITTCLIFAFVVVSSNNSYGDTFGSGLDTFDIDFVTIGDPGNAADVTGDPNPAGQVHYTYRMGKFEISEDMINKANALGGLGITHDERGPDKPATSISWLDAANFINWLNTSTSNSPAYKFDGDGNFQLWQPGDVGYDSTNPYRNSLAMYFLPSADEWYKAAYYDPDLGVYHDYPTGSNLAPNPVASGTSPDTAVFDGQVGPADILLAGGLSPYGTMAQGGNVKEWEETAFDLVNDLTIEFSGVRGGSWIDLDGILLKAIREGVQKDGKVQIIGVRVASSALVVPEPTTFATTLTALLLAFGQRRARRQPTSAAY